VKPGRPPLPADQRTAKRSLWFTPAELAFLDSMPPGYVRALVRSAMLHQSLAALGRVSTEDKRTDTRA
jgi:hypothetical protein